MWEVFRKGQIDQETFNCDILERMREREREMKMEGQMERIVSLEEEVAMLCWKKACMCGEGKGKGVTIASTSGDQEDQSELEYAEEEEGSSSGVSYHIPLIAPEETLLVFRSPISQSLPSKVQETSLGAEGVLPSRHIESFLRVFKQFTHNLLSRVKQVWSC